MGRAAELHAAPRLRACITADARARLPPAVTYAAFLIFVFVTAASDANDWVKGGLEFTFTPQNVATPMAKVMGCGDGSCLSTAAHGRQLQTITRQNYFHVALNQVAIDRPGVAGGAL